MRMPPQRGPAVRIEPDDLALSPDDQLALAVELDENRRAGSERKLPAAPRDVAALAPEGNHPLVAAAKRKNHFVPVGERARGEGVVVLQFERLHEVLGPSN